MNLLSYKSPQVNAIVCCVLSVPPDLSGQGTCILMMKEPVRFIDLKCFIKNKLNVHAPIL